MANLHPRPITAAELQRWIESGDNPPQLVDVREDAELAIAPFPAAVVHLPLSRSGDWLDTVPSRLPADRPVVVLCHAGVRSQHFGLWLLEQKRHGEVWNLEGGIDAWSVQVDSQVPRY
ncbi:MAG: sulfurtransferase [Planctomycetaceae bacterium TMED241]|jgi:rhodanese-related sulfurtransferase|uniref:rhodanese-like domain-containing protein n=1 Tax=Synechococcales TaxID=1890424 RepID=UPI0004E089F0|nr:rhodanese-like domain-containing protein [Synechococcus sp. KORDI-49]MBL6740022.1 sulfurtransferase [Synechococcus sp. BS301-5m-G54]MBL6795703.1 sulfurtransferase [Synechococcus sp. BS307-5m-G34]RCL55619.1 MAG: sulfurtransferase [Synechococcus sp. MED-G70]RPG11838.1 MAG: sulfurtransferase [Planctomycetaceae bacterium TMED241]HCX53108.1 sulfurtransferase [Synechococcus sp. UBA9887]|tara:strand:+ start:3594 stop:3947 length:354 start_codon:yes stop_codon:yes gene_type:complete